MSPAPVLHTRMLDVLFAVSAASTAVVGLDLPTTGLPTATARGVACLVGIAVLGAIWWWHRRAVGRSRIAATVTFTLIAMAVAVAGDIILAMLPLFCAVLLLALDVSAWAAAAPVVVLVVAQPVTMLAAGRTLDLSITQTVGTASVLAFVLAFALLLRRSALDNAVRLALLDERDAANARLTAANDRLRRSVETEKELVLARERARAATELHDGLGHRLTLVTMSLDYALRARERAPERAWAEVEGGRRAAGEAIDEMRLWVRALHPVSVEGLQGAAALDAVAEAFRGTGLDVRVATRGVERPLPDDVVLFLHRFVQEGLTNALRHAHARRVWIDLVYESRSVEVTLRDDGPTVGEVVPGFGLRSLADRVAHLGGTFEAHGGDGVVLAARIPTEGDTAAHAEGTETAETAETSETSGAATGGPGADAPRAHASVAAP